MLKFKISSFAEIAFKRRESVALATKFFTNDMAQTNLRVAFRKICSHFSFYSTRQENGFREAPVRRLSRRLKAVTLLKT